MIKLIKLFLILSMRFLLFKVYDQLKQINKFYKNLLLNFIFLCFLKIIKYIKNGESKWDKNLKKKKLNFN